MTVYDTGDHRIAGFGQQQSGDRSLTFTSQHGTVRVADLAVVDPAGAAPAAPAASARHPPARLRRGRARRPGRAASSASRRAAPAADDVLAKIERLADLRARDILTEQEFETKKAELLARL